MIDSDAQNYQSMAGNRNLHAANKVKKDVFYTQLSDIANELGKRIAELIKDSDVQKKRENINILSVASLIIKIEKVIWRKLLL